VRIDLEWTQGVDKFRWVSHMVWRVTSMDTAFNFTPYTCITLLGRPLRLSFISTIWTERWVLSQQVMEASHLLHQEISGTWQQIYNATQFSARLVAQYCCAEILKSPIYSKFSSFMPEGLETMLFQNGYLAFRSPASSNLSLKLKSSVMSAWKVFHVM
jgi:hypothetical protein